MPFHAKDNTGKLFDNKQDRTNHKAPDYTGTSLVNGKLMRVVMWHNPPTQQNPKATMSLIFQDYDEYQREREESKIKHRVKRSQHGDPLKK